MPVIIGYVYFIRCTENGLIKIGTCEGHALEGRLRAFSSQSPLPLALEKLGVLKGGRWEEKKLHGRFAHLRHHGEWFSPGQDLLSFVARYVKPWPESKAVILLDSDTDRAFDDMIGWVLRKFFRGEFTARGYVPLSHQTPPDVPTPKGDGLLRRAGEVEPASTG